MTRVTIDLRWTVTRGAIIWCRQRKCKFVEHSLQEQVSRTTCTLLGPWLPRRSLEIKTSLTMNATIGNVTVASHVVADSQYVVVEEMFILRSVLGAARHQPLQLSAHTGHTNV